MPVGRITTPDHPTLSSDHPIRFPGPLGTVTLRGDRATASLPHICNFRFLSFFCSISLFKGTRDAAR